MSNCTDKGNHIEFSQWKSNVRFIIEHRMVGNNILISGGEPFEHPDIFDLLNYLMRELGNNRMHPVISIISNGYDLSNSIEYLEKYKKLVRQWDNMVLLQVTNDSRYYPIKLSSKQIYRLSRAKAIIDDKLQGLYPQGRALLNYPNENWLTKCPKCTNARLIVHQEGNNASLEKIVNWLARNNKYCTPRIGIKGEIGLGESLLCPPVGYITDSELEILAKIRVFHCNQCKISLARLKSFSIDAYNMIEDKEEI
jgi:organic radical activating enzyme